MGCQSSSVAPVEKGEAPMLPLQNVAVNVTPAGVVITWDPNTQSNLRGYNVYRLDGASQSVQKLTANPILDTKYFDGTVVEQETYGYWVTSVSTQGNESSFETLQVRVPNSLENKRDREDS